MTPDFVAQSGAAHLHPDATRNGRKGSVAVR